MKKLITFAFCLICLVALIAGCSNNDILITEPTIETTTTTTEPLATESSHEHEYTEKVMEATCVTGGKTIYTCKMCGDFYVDNLVDSLGHDYEKKTVNATYTTKGYDLHTCKVCGHVVKDNETDIIPHDHKYEKKATEPTCTKKGYTTHTCSLCGHSYKDAETDMIEHNYDKKTVASTCTTKGYDLYTCRTCKKEYRENETEKLAHEYDKKVVGATCTEKGYDVYTCKGCNKSYKDNYVNMIPHQYDVKTVKPTCTENGYDFNGCVICGGGMKSNEVPALGHNYVTETVKPTAKEKGYDVHTCSRCNDTYKDNYTDPIVTYKEVNETVYAKSDVNIRKGPSTDFEKLGSLAKGKSITRVGIGDNDWSKVMYNDTIAYIHSDYLTTEEPPTISVNGYPKTYSDSTAKITITKEKFKNSWCYIAHLEFSDYSRFGSTCGNNKLGSGETTSHAAKRVGAIFAVNGPYMGKEYSVVRSGKVFYDVPIIADLAIYNTATGKLENAGALGLTGMKASEAVENGLVSDTFKFYNSTLVSGGKNVANPNNNDRAQRTFIGTTGKAGDIYIVVSEGRYADGESNGLRKYDCASLLVELGCTYGVMLDGGGSSTMYFNGKVLNSAKNNQRAVIDFVYFK